VSGPGITDLMHRVLSASTGPRAAAGGITLPGIPESVPIARRLVADALPGCPRADDLMLTVSELVSNAIFWSRSGRRDGTFTVRVRTAPRWARVEVTDDGTAAGSPSGGNGWGLKIVAGVTDRSGATIDPDGRRTEWAEVTWSAEPPAARRAHRGSRSLPATGLVGGHDAASAAPHRTHPAKERTGPMARPRLEARDSWPGSLSRSVPKDAGQPNFLTVLEVADMLRVSRMTAYRLTRSGELASCRFGGSIRVPETALREYMQKASTRRQPARAAGPPSGS
jgi:excisionase family DNA binding protein